MIQVRDIILIAFNIQNRFDKISQAVMGDVTIIKYTNEVVSGIADSIYSNSRKAEVRKEIRGLGRYLYWYKKITGNKKLTLLDTFTTSHEKFLGQVAKGVASEYKHPHPLKKLHQTLGLY